MIINPKLGSGSECLFEELGINFYFGHFCNLLTGKQSIFYLWITWFISLSMKFESVPNERTSLFIFVLFILSSSESYF